MEKNESLQFLEKHKSSSPSRFQERAQWRRENQGWLRWSQSIAISLVAYMEENNLKRSELAEILGVSTQYLGRLMSGTENLSLKSIANIEDRLGINCLFQRTDTLGQSEQNNELHPAWRVMSK